MSNKPEKSVNKIKVYAVMDVNLIFDNPEGWFDKTGTRWVVQQKSEEATIKAFNKKYGVTLKWSEIGAVNKRYMGWVLALLVLALVAGYAAADVCYVFDRGTKDWVECKDQAQTNDKINEDLAATAREHEVDYAATQLLTAQQELNRTITENEGSK